MFQSHEEEKNTTVGLISKNNRKHSWSFDHTEELSDSSVRIMDHYFGIRENGV